MWHRIVAYTQLPDSRFSKKMLGVTWQIELKKCHWWLSTPNNNPSLKRYFLRLPQGVIQFDLSQIQYQSNMDHTTVVYE